jgi:hypothetical protein
MGLLDVGTDQRGGVWWIRSSVDGQPARESLAGAPATPAPGGSARSGVGRAIQLREAARAPGPGLRPGRAAATRVRRCRPGSPHGGHGPVAARLTKSSPHVRGLWRRRA